MTALLFQPIAYPTTVLDGPLIFLAGPIVGTWDWQAKAIDTLHTIAPDVHVASPRTHPFHGDHDAQVAWETFFLRRAAQDGAILFWLARERSHRCDRAYAQTTRFEIGEWAAKSVSGNMVVGIEANFSGEAYIKHRLAKNYPHVPICRTLKQTVAAAAELAQRTRRNAAQLQKILDLVDEE